MGDDKPMAKLAERVNQIPKGTRRTAQAKSCDEMKSLLAYLREENRANPAEATRGGDPPPPEPAKNARAPQAPPSTEQRPPTASPDSPPERFPGQRNLETWLETTTAMLLKVGVTKDRSQYLADALDDLAVNAANMRVSCQVGGRQMSPKFAQLFRCLASFVRGATLPTLPTLESAILVDILTSLEKEQAELEGGLGPALAHLRQISAAETVSLPQLGGEDAASGFLETRSINPLALKAHMLLPEPVAESAAGVQASPPAGEAGEGSTQDEQDTEGPSTRRQSQSPRRKRKQTVPVKLTSPQVKIRNTQIINDKEPQSEEGDGQD